MMMAAVPHEHEHPRMVTPAARSAVVEIEQSRAIAEVQAGMLLARRFPRDEIAARDKIVNAFTNPSLAAVAKYSYARGGTDIEGASIHSLRAIARQWGNISTGIEEISRASGQSECRAYAIDMETGFKDEKKFVVRHIRDTKGGGKVLTEERDIYELIANMGARRQRACLESVIPRDVLDDAMTQVDTTLAADFEITADYLASLQTAFEKYGITKPMIEGFIQRHLEAMTPAQAARLKKIHTSLKDGVGTPEDWFDTKLGAAAGVQAEPPVTRTEAVKDKIKKNQAARAPKAQAEPPVDAAPSSSEPPAQQSGGPEPITDEAVALTAMERAQDEGEGELVLARCEGQPFRPRIVGAWNERFRTTTE